MQKKQICILIAVAIILAMIIPRLFINYGMDADAVRSVKVAEEFFFTGEYHTSRLPGNPLFEYILALIVPWGGHVASNIFVFLFYLAGVGAFSFLVKESDLKLLLTGIFSLTPILIVNAVTTMDYVPGLALLLGAYIGATKARYLPSSLFLGFAIGFRLFNILFIIPLTLFLLLKRHRIYNIISFFLSSILIGISFYIPILIQEGFGMFRIPASLWSGTAYVLRTAYNGLMLFGPIASLGILVIVLANNQNIIKSIKENIKLKSASFYMEIMTMTIFLVIFLIRSDETDYLIPAIPFFYLLISRWLSKKQLIFISILIISFSFFSVEFKGGESGRRKITFKPTGGVVIKDYLDRKEIETLRDRIGQIDISEKAVVLTGMGHILTYKNNSLLRTDYKEISLDLLKDGIAGSSNIYRIKDKNIYFIHALSLENVNILHKRGYRVYIFSEFAPTILINRYGYNPYQNNIKKVEILNKKTFYKAKQ